MNKKTTDRARLNDIKILKFKKIKLAVLVLLAFFSIISFFNLGSFLSYKLNQPSYIYYWDFFHYYIGSKYFPELGYYNLYYATVVADAEDDNYLEGIDNIMNVKNYHFIRRQAILKNAAVYKNLFSPKRWEEFKSDIRFIKKQFSPDSFGYYILADHGYIASPIVTFTNYLLAKSIPVGKVFFLSLLDVFLLIIMFWIISSSFGLEIMLVSVIFFSVSYLSNFDWIGGSFLRYDWLVASVIALCMINKDRYRLAGVFLSYAVLTRIFPIFFVLAIGLRSVIFFIKERTFPGRHKELFISFIVASALLFLYGSSHSRGIDNWKNFSQRIAQHNQALLINNTGFKMVFLYDKSWENIKSFLEVYGKTDEKPFVLFKEMKRNEFNHRKSEFFIFLVISLFLFYLTIKNKSDVDSFAWAGFLIFMFSNISCYYYAFLLMFILIFYKGEVNLTNTLYLVFLFTVQILDYVFAGNYFSGFWPRIYYRASLFLFIYFIYLVICEAYLKFRGKKIIS